MTSTHPQSAGPFPPQKGPQVVQLLPTLRGALWPPPAFQQPCSLHASHDRELTPHEGPPRGPSRGQHPCLGFSRGCTAPALSAWHLPCLLPAGHRLPRKCSPVFMSRKPQPMAAVPGGPLSALPRPWSPGVFLSLAFSPGWGGSRLLPLPPGCPPLGSHSAEAAGGGTRSRPEPLGCRRTRGRLPAAPALSAPLTPHAAVGRPCRPSLCERKVPRRGHQPRRA